MFSLVLAAALLAPIEESMLDQYQVAVLEACENAQAQKSESADFKEAVLDAVKFWD